MDEAARSISSSQSISNQQKTAENGSPDSNTSVQKKSVKFESEEEDAHSAQGATQQRPSSLQKRSSDFPFALRTLADSRMKSPSSEYATNKFLKICPREEIIFNVVTGETKLADVVVLINESPRNVMYELKSTAPGKFTVQPASGVIVSGSTQFIEIYLQEEHKGSVNKEKLKLMAVETDKETSEDFSSLWKSAKDECKMEHKWRCRLAEGCVATKSVTTLPSPTATPVETGSQASLEKRITDLIQSNDILTRRHSSLIRRHNVLIFCVLLLICLQIFSLTHQRLYYTTIMASLMRKECHPVEPANIEPLDVDLNESTTSDTSIFGWINKQISKVYA